MPDSHLQKRVSLRDIAEELGISHVSVSLALRDSPRISAERKQQVREAAARLGYRPDPMLTALAAYRRSKGGEGIHSALAWFNQWEDKKRLRSFKEFDAYWKGAQEMAERLGYHIDEFQLTPDMTAKRLSGILKTRNIRGILIPPHGHGVHLDGFDWENYSVVRFGFSVKQRHAHLVGADMMGNMIVAYENMRAIGYQRIGIVSEKYHEQNSRFNACAGFLAGQQKHLPLEAHLPPLLLDSDDEQTSMQMLKEWMLRYRPDGIITSQPKTQAMLEALGYNVPNDVGIAGTSILDLPYDTGIDQNSQEIGRVAISVLTGLIYENETGNPTTIRRTMVEGFWVQGKSLPPRT